MYKCESVHDHSVKTQAWKSKHLKTFMKYLCFQVNSGAGVGVRVGLVLNFG